MRLTQELVMHPGLRSCCRRNSWEALCHPNRRFRILIHTVIRAQPREFCVAAARPRTLVEPTSAGPSTIAKASVDWTADRTAGRPSRETTAGGAPRLMRFVLGAEGRGRGTIAVNGGGLLASGETDGGGRRTEGRGEGGGWFFRPIPFFSASFFFRPGPASSSTRRRSPSARSAAFAFNPLKAGGTAVAEAIRRSFAGELQSPGDGRRETRRPGLLCSFAFFRGQTSMAGLAWRGAADGPARANPACAEFAAARGTDRPRIFSSRSNLARSEDIAPRPYPT